MKDDNKKNTMESSEQDDTKNDLSRREFLTKSTGAIAVGSAIGLMGGASIGNMEVFPPLKP